jgi:hypothetical protein
MLPSGASRQTSADRVSLHRTEPNVTYWESEAQLHLRLPTQQVSVLRNSWIFEYDRGVAFENHSNPGKL